MAGVNSCTFIGNLGHDPQNRVTASGMAVCSFSIAITEKSKGEDKTLWLKVVAFDKLADVCGQYLKKGKQVYIQGRLQIEEWTDRDGNKRTTPQVIANQMQMLGSKGDENAPRASQDQPGPQNYGQPIPNHGQGGDRAPETMAGSKPLDPMSDDIPF